MCMEERENIIIFKNIIYYRFIIKLAISGFDIIINFAKNIQLTNQWYRQILKSNLRA